MALWKPFRGNRIALDAVEKHDGYVYFCVDDGALFFDYVDADGNLQRKQINAKEAETIIGYDIDNMNSKITTLETQMADVLYEAISISSFTHNKGTQERGAVITDVTLSWVTNKTPTTLTLDGEAIDVSTTSKTISGLSLTWNNNKTWKLIATDTRDATAEKTVSITFCNGIYYGVGTVENSFDSTFVTSLSKRLQTSKAYDFTVNPTAQYIYYAVPTRLGTVSFKVGGFEGGFESPETVSVTNSSNYTENYYVYRSTNKITGSTTVDVT